MKQSINLCATFGKKLSRVNLTSWMRLSRINWLRSIEIRNSDGNFWRKPRMEPLLSFEMLHEYINLSNFKCSHWRPRAKMIKWMPCDLSTPNRGKNKKKKKRKPEKKDFKPGEHPKCYRCNETGHFACNCPALNKTCSKCGFTGHLAVCCKTKNPKRPPSGRPNPNGA